jgi:thiol:disulfide interchange protein/DsbC/DsbD-like thiol-disulfide interchange protein
VRISSIPFGRVLGAALLLLVLALGAGAEAQQSPVAGGDAPGPRQRTLHTLSQLVAETDGVVPGRPVLLGLHQRFDPGWHSYWRNPGDSGFPATLAWRLPPGAAAGPVLWPAPERQRFGTLTNYGHKDSLVLLAEIAVPPGLRTGEVFEIDLSASWLICAEICIPEDTRLTLRLPVAAQAGPGAGASLLAAARDALPTAAPWPARFARVGDRLRLRLDGPDLVRAPLLEAYFFPHDGDLIEHAAPQRLAIDPAGMTLDIPLGREGARKSLDRLEGVLRFETGAGGAARNSFAIAAAPGMVAPPPGRALASPAAVPAFLDALLLALLGGAILNLMPCVFPILSMKALAIASLPSSDRAARRREGTAYGLGVLTCFAIIAAAMAALRAAGAELGWGVQFQSPGFVAAMAVLMLAIGLNLSGVYDIDLLRPAIGGTHRGGGAGAFLTGALAVLVATPCTAPFMAAALGMALAADGWTMVAVLMALGTGFAAPFVLLAWLPGLGRALPRPGPWMLTLRGALAFPMYATCAWLIWVLSQQVGAAGLALALGALVALGLAAWLFGQPGAGAAATARRAGAVILAVASVAAAIATGSPGIAGDGQGVSRAAASEASGGPKAEIFSAARLDALRAEGRPVFVNMTAAWCITCLFNEANALASAEMRALFLTGGVVYLKGDWTRQDPEISAYLRGYGRSGVPLYVFYPARGGEPRLLPQLLDEQILRQALAARPGA